MSVAELSQTVKKHIVSRLKEVITGSTEIVPTPRVLKNFAEYASSSSIRTSTNTKIGKHESIMSRDGFDMLIAEMQKAVDAKMLDSMALDIINNINFNDFVRSVSKDLTGNVNYFSDKNTRSRTKAGYTYTGVSRATKNTTPLLVTSTTDSDKDVLIVKNLPHGRIVEMFINYILDNASTNVNKEQLAKSLYANLQGGHITGVFTARLIRSLGLQQDIIEHNAPIRFNRTSNQELSILEQSLNQIVTLVSDADYLSSNIVYDIELFTNTDKRLFTNTAELRLTTEIQVKSTNKAAGDLLTTAGAYLSKLIQTVKHGVSTAGQEAAAADAYSKLLINLSGVSKYVKDRATEVRNSEKALKDPALIAKLNNALDNANTFDILLNTKGSPSILQHIETVVACTILGTKVPTSSTTAKTKDVIKTVQKPRAPTSKRISSKKSTFALRPVRNASAASTSSLASLQNLLNRHLQDVISANMGDGNSRNVLNYRTGRFAESAKVERLTQSKEGMITAFYSYMRNPYRTFSEGGKQAYPRSRDPKLLISKSIKEIAMEAAVTRMRAVVI